MQLLLGIDPGKSGGAVLLSEDHTVVRFIAFKKGTTLDVIEWIEDNKKEIVFCYLEGVGARPTDGVVPAFKFGQNYGWWECLIQVSRIPFQRVYPLKWQTYMSCRTGGNKNISKARAQELFPKIKVTHAIADALLIAEYGRRQSLQKVSDL